MARSVISATPTGARVEARIIPRAPRNAIGGVRDGRILVRVTAPPVDQAANEAVVALLADILHLPKRAIRIVAGAAARNKSIEIDGLSPEEVSGRVPIAPDGAGGPSGSR
jgi:uncharacterized protein YggU (UPF0235/DUF167 family)